MGKRGAWPRSRDLLCKFLDPLISPKWLMIQTSNFACIMKAGILNQKMLKEKNEKQVKRGHGLRHVSYFSNFGTRLIDLERLKLQTSNFACRWTVRDTHSERKNMRDTKPQKRKIVQKGALRRSNDLLFKFQDPLISLEQLEDTNLKFYTWIEGKGPDTIQKLQKQSKRGVAQITCNIQVQ